MTHSLNEIEALSKRAARGAGMSWGMSEEASKATRWLTSHGLSGAGLLADVLTQNDRVAHVDVAPMSLDGIWKGRSGVLCPLISGAALNDCAARLEDDQLIEMQEVSHPLIVIPFAAWAALHINAPVMVTWDDVRLKTDGFGLWMTGPMEQIETTQPVTLTCMRARSGGELIKMPERRGQVRATSWAKLSAFAHRTYTPATEESRALGAGAGTSDND